MKLVAPQIRNTQNQPRIDRRALTPSPYVYGTTVDRDVHSGCSRTSPNFNSNVSFISINSTTTAGWNTALTKIMLSNSSKKVTT